MSIVQTVLVFVGIPAGTFAVFAAIVLGPGSVRAPRYRPGSEWNFAPVWYLPHPAHNGPVSELHASGGAEAGARLALTGSTVTHPTVASGGASGEW
ncbi:hypothetical protein M6D93_06485 [Jatrophihabitans telluris]|uniref:Uncharacterized protein n=1 Tax=Jatrophihabitans telluris TaxID=2038343 RepID=A0ABY4R2D6_9ACTN|nr:hypothetical protein [Jatrophihabitans telluris]UQX89647.1 hypothetical protein M6D93_06485 [Jatrophihabitans telluris]